MDYTEHFTEYQIVSLDGTEYRVQSTYPHQVNLECRSKREYLEIEHTDPRFDRIKLLEKVQNTTIENSQLEELTYSTNQKLPFKDVENIKYRLTPRWYIGGSDKGLLYEELSDDKKEFYKDKKEWYLKVCGDLDTEEGFYETEKYISDYDIRAIYKKMTTDEIAKFKFSSAYTTTRRFEFYYDNNPTIIMMNKIVLSGWHTGYNTFQWNDLVDVYNLIKTFDLDKKDFSIEHDITSGCNSKGYSKYTRTFLDGELAFIVKYKNKHVLTISYNVTIDRQTMNPKIQILQIQCVEKKGNRFLFKFEKDYIQEILFKFVSHFSEFRIELVKSKTLMDEIGGSYRASVKRFTKSVKKERIENKKDDDGDASTYYIDRLKESRKNLKHYEAFGVSSIKTIYGRSFEKIGKKSSKNGYNVLYIK